MAQGLKGLNQGGGYDWETPYLNYLINLPQDQQEYGQNLYNEYKFAKNYIQQNNINLGQGSIEDYTNLFHTIYQNYGGVQQQQQTPQQSQNQPVIDLSNIDLGDIQTGDSYMGHSANEFRFDVQQFEEMLPYIKDTEARLKKFDENIEDFNRTYQEKYFEAPPANVQYRSQEDARDINAIKQIAQQVSPYYRMYGEGNLSGAGEYISYSDREWLELSLTYNRIKETQGEDTANAYLDQEFQNRASANQSTLEQYWRGLTGMGASAAGALIQFAGAVQGAAEYLVSPEDYDVEGLNGLENFIYAMENSSLANYGNNVVKYGTFDPVRQAYAAENNLSYNQIMRTVAQEQGSFEDQIFNRSTLPYALSQGGFTVASMLIGGLEAKMAKGFFKGLARGSKYFIKDPAKLYKTYRTIGKAHQFTNNYVIPMVAGTAEGLVEGKQTQDEVYETGMKYLNSMQEEMYNEAYSKIMNEEGMQIYNDVYAQFHEGQSPVNINTENLPDDQWLRQILSAPATDETDLAVQNTVKQILQDKINSKYADKFNAAKQQIEYASAKAGVNNFLLNSCINGIANQTLKAGINAPSVQRTLANSRAFGWAQPRPHMKISGTTATPKYGFFAKAWDITKEPLGEFTEEYLQTVSDATAQGGAEYNIHSYIDNLYNNKAMDAIGTTYKGQSAAAWRALGESLISKEAMVSGVYGALSSGMGTPMIRRSNYIGAGRVNPETGKPEGRTFDAFRRRETGDGQREGFFEYMGRVTPWRSGVGEGISRVREKQRMIENEAQAMTDWLSDPENQAKFKDITGSISWGRRMQEAADAGDEFGYRNSVLGKTINDAFMLAKLKRTNPGMHENLMAYYKKLAQMDPNSDEAQQIADDYNGGVADENQRVTPEEIKKNAQKVLETIEKVQKEDLELRQTFGDIDEDVRQALAYGRLMMEDWEDRGQTLEREIGTVLSKTGLKDSVEGATPARELIQRVISKYGNSRESLVKKSQELKEEARGKDSEAAKLTHESGRAKTKAIRLDKKSQAKVKKAEAKTLKKEAREIDEALKAWNASVGEDITMSESDILNAEPTLRGQMLNPVNYSRFSKEQQAVIDRVLNAGKQALGSQFVSKVVDSGRLTRETRKFMKQYGDLVENPESLQFYSDSAKRAVETSFAKKQADAIAQIQDYEEFALQMDKVLSSGSQVQQGVLRRVAEESENPLFQEYTRKKLDADQLLRQIQEDDEFKEMWDDQKQLMGYMVDYLASQSGDLDFRNDIGGAINVLQDTERFKKYLESVLPKGTSLNKFDLSPENLANLYQTLVGRANANREKLAKREEVKTPDADTHQDPPAPAPAPGTPTQPQGPASIFSQAPTDPNREARNESQVAQIISRTVESVRNTINSNTELPQYNSDALALIDEINVGDMEDQREFLNEISRICTDLRASGGEKNLAVARILENAMKTETHKVNKADASTKSTSIVDRPNPDAGTMETKWLGDTPRPYWSSNPTDSNYNWILDFQERYHIQDFLRSGAVKRGTVVYYTVLPESADAVSKSLGGGNLNNVKIDQRPLIAVVEVEQADEYSIPIEFTDNNGNTTTKYYRPIGVMPSSGIPTIQGSNRSRAIREASNYMEFGTLLRQSDGRYFTGQVHAIQSENPKRLGVGNRISLSDLLVDSFVPEQDRESVREQLQTSRSKTLRENASLKDAVKRFFERGAKEGRFTKSGRGGIFYTVDTLRTMVKNGNDNDAFDAIILFRAVSRSNSTSGQTMEDVLANGSADEVQNFNSRTKRWVSTLTSALTTEKFNPIDEETGQPSLGVTEREDGKLDSTNEAKKKLKSIAERLTKDLGRFITFKTSENAYYSIELQENDGSYSYNLVLYTTSNPGGIVLGEVWNSTYKENLSDRQASQILRNLLKLNEPQADDRDELIKWSIDFGDISGTSTNQEKASENVVDLLVDDIIDMSVDRLVATPKGVLITAPGSKFTVNTESAKPKEPTANQDNADSNSTQNPASTPGSITTQDGTQIDDDGSSAAIDQQKPAKPDVFARVKTLFDKLTQFSRSSNNNVATGNNQIVIDGNVTYNLINSLLGFQSSITMDDFLDSANDNLEANSLYVVKETAVITGEMEATTSDGNTTYIKVANNDVRLVIDASGSQERLGIIMQVEGDTSLSKLEEMLALTMRLAGNQLQQEVTFAKVALMKDGEFTGKFRTYDKQDLNLNELEQLHELLADQIPEQVEKVEAPTSTVTEETPMISELAPGSTTQNLARLIAERQGKAKQGQTQEVSKEYAHPTIRWGVWDNSDGTSRSKQEIAQIKQFFAEQEIFTEEAYEKYFLEQNPSAKSINDLQDVIEQTLGCI